MRIRLMITLTYAALVSAQAAGAQVVSGGEMSRRREVSERTRELLRERAFDRRATINERNRERALRSVRVRNDVQRNLIRSELARERAAIVRSNLRSDIRSNIRSNIARERIRDTNAELRRRLDTRSMRSSRDDVVQRLERERTISEARARRREAAEWRREVQRNRRRG